MKKRITFFISHNLAKIANDTIREKSDIINLILETLPEIILVGKTENKDKHLGYCEVLVGKMSRIIFTLQDESSGKMYKKFSFAFPFQLEKQMDPLALTSWTIYDSNNIEVNSQVVSVIHSLSRDGWFDDNLDTSSEALVFYEEILTALKDIEVELAIDEINIWHVIRKLFLFEPGYLRYDHDDNDQRVDELYHPLHHLDIFFSNKATLKIGLLDEHAEKETWNLSGFENLLNSEMPCYFLK